MRYQPGAGTALAMMLLLSLPAGGQAQTTTGSKATADQNKGQRLTAQQSLEALREGTLGLYNRKLKPSEVLLRDQITTMQDSLAPVKEGANRITQALRRNTNSVALSALKRLEPACNNAALAATQLRPGVKSLTIKASNPAHQERYNKSIRNYQKAFEEVAARVTTCQKTAGGLAQSKSLNSASTLAMTTQLQESILVFESTARALLTEFDIPLMPRQLKREKGGL